MIADSIIKYSDYEQNIINLIDKALVSVSDISPSDWYEENRYMTSDVSPIPGMFRYDNSPYTREIVDCLSPSHPSRRVAVMKGAQIGFSAGVIEAGIGWIISQNPGNILSLVGHEDLVKDTVSKVDRMIDNTGIRSLIKSSSKRARNVKSGDTDRMKEFIGGNLKLGSANHKTLRQISVQYGFMDDFESMKTSSKESGDTRALIEKRFVAFEKKKKIFYISTPELKETSNIEPVYLLGDQRKFNLICPCCEKYIPLEWKVNSELDENKTAGITWYLDEKGNLIEDSVGYTCQKCGEFFDDRNKTEMMQSGKWIPTAEPAEPGNYSYHISSLYAPVYMKGWAGYVRDYLEANPVNQKRDEEKWKTFVTTSLGQTYEPTGESISANQLQENIRPYEIGLIPDKLSMADGNGKIVMITCGCDLNGKVEGETSGPIDDARLDYEIVAYSESGATYSVTHGSIGTFIKGEKKKSARTKMSYKHGVHNSVWPMFEKIITRDYVSDLDGRKMQIFTTGLDTGHFTDYAYKFVDYSNGNNVYSLKGDDDAKMIKIDADFKSYKKSKNKNNLFLTQNNYTKDVLARKMGLNWDHDGGESQPSGFMNFPTPSNGLYLFRNYFAHYEAEHKIFDKTGSFRWVRKHNKENHLFDCRLYADVAKDIFMDKLFLDAKIKNGIWADYVTLVTGINNK
jgi:phage terminase large subunit GpA-like protein